MGEARADLAIDLNAIALRAKEIRSWMIGNSFRAVQIRILTGEEVPSLIDEVRRLRNVVDVATHGVLSEEIGNMPIERLHLVKRLQQSLQSRGIRKVADLVVLRPEEIRAPGVGDSTINKLRTVLHRRGLTLREDP